MIYLDSCALVKLVRTEDGSNALQECAVDSDILDRAGALTAPMIRTLDAPADPLGSGDLPLT